MIGATPSVFDASLSRSDTGGIDAYVERHAPGVGYAYYGAGKVALRDGLAGLVEPGGNVLVPAYLSPAVVEPFRELGLEPRFYALEGSLAPDFADLEARMDEDTVAVTSVNYFGFPQPGLERLADLTDEYDCYHIDDNAHGPISVADGRLLGTHGDLGFTTLRKLLPVPDGAVLYLASDEAEAAFEPSALAGSADRLGAGDCRYLATSVAETALDPLYRSIESFLADGDASSVDPIARYEASKAPMSKLSAAVIDAADPDAIRDARRENFRAWTRVLADRDDLAPLYEELPAGISPYEYPVLAADPSSFLAELEDCGVAGAHTWPILRESVRGDDAYETANRYSQSVVALPVHQGIDPADIEAVGDRLRR